MRITGQNLDETVKINNEINREVQEQIKYHERYLKKYRINSTEKLAMQILKDHNLIQVPIPDPDWGGAIYELPNGQKIPVLNTAQSRLYQYFICWHEVYHLTEESKQSISHSISTEFDLIERKADYFASQMLIGNDLFVFYSDLKNQDFIDRIAYCMDTFKAPYKAILIQLYEDAIRFEDKLLQREIKAHFDLKLDQNQWEEKLKELSLDDSLVKPTGIIDFGKLKKVIEEKSNQHTDVDLYSDNLDFLLALEKKLQDAKEELTCG